jgi:pyruvate dehydrogenase E2 component (dihydrolipoyllysine-residue acetyltransferase)
MPTDVLMPQMGESIAEGTIVRWIKKVGDRVDRDEPLFEISTDKVDAEIPSPAAGTVAAIKVKEGETVPVNSVVATIAAAGEAVDAASGTPADASAPAAQAEKNEWRDDDEDAKSSPAAETREDLRRRKSSPLVRKIAREHNIDIASLSGSGVSGRVTKDDILGAIERSRPDLPPSLGATADRRSLGEGGKVGRAPSQPGAPERVTKAAPPPAGANVVAFKPGERVRVEPMSVMRKKIAEHMVLSARTSPHVYSVYEVNFAQIAKLRDAKTDAYEAQGVKLTFTGFIAKATVDALRAFPIVNASLDGDNIVYKADINLGIAVALDWGLIVPVIRNADEKNLLGISRAIQDLAARARAKKLQPEEVQGGTFTITNPGIFGAAYGLPMINQPQVAILGVGAIEKRAVVVEDAIGIRPMCYLSLGYDHRLVDGADAGRFLQYLKERLEGFDESWT